MAHVGRIPCHVLQCCVLGAVWLHAPQAGADAKTECLNAHERGQTLRVKGKLIGAREAFATCARDVCPVVVREECAQAAGDVRSALPTVVFAARGADGLETTAVRVHVDGETILDELGARAIEIDPGRYTFRFEAEDGTVVESSHPIREGEKNRRIEVQFPPRTSSEPANDTPVSPWAYILGGVGLAGLGGFTYFALSGRSQESDLAACKPRCSQDDYDAMRRSYLIADISLGIGVIGLGLSTYLFLSGTKSENEAAPAAWLDVRPSNQGGFVQAWARF